MTQCAVSYDSHGTQLVFTGPIPNPNTMHRKLVLAGFRFFPNLGPQYVEAYYQIGYSVSPDDIQYLMPYVEVVLRNGESW